MTDTVTLDPATFDLAAAEALEERILLIVEYVYGADLNQDANEKMRTTIRAMIVKGGTASQITQALTIAAANERISIEDKTRYAFGCLRNIMMEQPAPYRRSGEEEDE